MKLRVMKQRGAMPISCRPRLLKALELGLAESGLQGTGCLNVIFTTLDNMVDINKKYLNHIGPTDVITFDLRSEDFPEEMLDEEECIGEIYVSPDVACDYARKNGLSPSRELVLYAIHGMLHLAGEDDLTEEACVSMRAAEARVMAAIEKRYSVEGFIS